MKNELEIVIAEDDPGHAELIVRNLKRTGINNRIIHFKDGQEALDFFFMKDPAKSRVAGRPYLLLLDIRMPKVDGIEVLKRIKSDGELKKLPVIMLTTTDDPIEVERCHKYGCNNYITKPIDPAKFINAINQLGLFLLVIETPRIDGDI